LVETLNNSACFSVSSALTPKSGNQNCESLFLFIYQKARGFPIQLVCIPFIFRIRRFSKVQLQGKSDFAPRRVLWVRKQANEELTPQMSLAGQPENEKGTRHDERVPLLRGWSSIWQPQEV